VKATVVQQVAEVVDVDENTDAAARTGLPIFLLEQRAK
jgi:hypothetical protein